MAYQNVGKPRFYISWGDWARALGSDVLDLHTISPTQTQTFNFSNYYSLSGQSEIPFNPEGLNFFAALNHNAGGIYIPEAEPQGEPAMIPDGAVNGMGNAFFPYIPEGVNYYDYAYLVPDPSVYGMTIPNIIKPADLTNIYYLPNFWFIRLRNIITNVEKIAEYYSEWDAWGGSGANTILSEDYIISLKRNSNDTPYPNGAEVQDIFEYPYFWIVEHLRTGQREGTAGLNFILKHNVYNSTGGIDTIRSVEAGSDYENDINIGAVESDGFSFGTLIEAFGGDTAYTQHLIQTGARSVDDTIIPDPVNIGCTIFGKYYDMPNSPNLSLTMSREYGGTKEFTTYNGSSMSNTMWHSVPKWGSRGAWELDEGTSSSQALSRSGRRTWDLKFSYMDDGNLFGSNQMLTDYLETATGLTDEDLIISADNSQERITNPADRIFTSDTGAWEILSSGTGLSIDDDVSGKMVITTTTATTPQGVSLQLSYIDGVNEYQNLLPIEAGKMYQVSADIYTASPGGSNTIINFGLGGTAGSAGTIGASTGNYEKNITTVNNTGTLQIYNASGTAFTIVVDNVSVKELIPSAFQYNLLSDDNFFSQVWHPTLGGTLPFIFQPDSSNSNPDQFAICKFVDGSLKTTQTAHNVYDISLRIEEVW